MVGFGYVSIASASQEWFGGGGGYLTKSQTFKPMRSMRCMSHAVGKIIRSSSTFFISGGYLRTVVHKVPLSKQTKCKTCFGGSRMILHAP